MKGLWRSRAPNQYYAGAAYLPTRLLSRSENDSHVAKVAHENAIVPHTSFDHLGFPYLLGLALLLS